MNTLPASQFIAVRRTAHLKRTDTEGGVFAPGETYCGGTGYRGSPEPNYSNKRSPAHVTQYCVKCSAKYARENNGAVFMSAADK